MSIYDDLLPDVREIIAEFAQGAITLVTVTPSTGPADDPGTPTETPYTLDATASGVSFKYVQSGLAVSTDLMVVAATIDGVTPSEKDFITIDSVRYKIVQDVSVPAAGTKLVWKFIVRKGG